jgi:hypothetical protein
MLLHWGSVSDESTLAESLQVSFILLSWAATIFWVLSGFALVDLVIKVPRWLVTALRRFIPVERLRTVAAAVVLIHPVPAVVIFLAARRGSLLRQFTLGDGVVALLVLVFGLVLLAGRRWDLRNALTALTLSLVAPVFGLGMALALRGVDISALAAVAVQSTNVVPPLLLFVVVMAYNVFGLMSGFANTEGKAIPRRARILLCFGAALLIIAFAIFFVNMRVGDSGELNQSFQNWTNNIFAISVFLLGIPYLVWVVWKRRERLVGKV